MRGSADARWGRGGLDLLVAGKGWVNGAWHGGGHARSAGGRQLRQHHLRANGG